MRTMNSIARFILSVAYREGDGGGDGGAGGGDGGQGGGAGGQGVTTYTKEQFEAELSKRLGEKQKAQQNLLDELETLRQKTKMTAKEREEADARIETLRGQLLTKEEQAKRELAKATKEKESLVGNLTQERDQWKTKYTQATITRSLTDAAVEHNAYNPAQLVSILGGNTQLVERVGDDGQPTGELDPIVKFNDVDKDGKPVTLDLSPSDAVKRMKEMDQWLNLFKGDGTGGLGLRKQGQPGTKLTQEQLAKLAKENPTEYRKQRAAFGL